MTNHLPLFIDQLKTNPKKIFLIDGVGAFLSAFFLGIILVKFEVQFGMPKTILFFLSSVACLFMLYSFCCYLLVVNNWRTLLKLIIAANTIYCCFTIGLLFYFYKSLTILGFIYFLLELILLISLILIERKVYLKAIHRKFTN